MRSVNEALAVVTPMLVDSEVASVAKARGLLRLEGLLGVASVERSCRITQAGLEGRVAVCCI